jgi:hypothetical protein
LLLETTTRLTSHVRVVPKETDTLDGFAVHAETTAAGFAMFESVRWTNVLTAAHAVTGERNETNGVNAVV